MRCDGSLSIRFVYDQTFRIIERCHCGINLADVQNLFFGVLKTKFASGKAGDHHGVVVDRVEALAHDLKFALGIFHLKRANLLGDRGVLILAPGGKHHAREHPSQRQTDQAPEHNPRTVSRRNWVLVKLE